MTVPAGDLVRIREWVGSSPPTGDLDALWDTIENPSWCQVAMSVLRARHADLVTGPDGFTVTGEYSETVGSGKAGQVAAQIRALAVQCGVPDPLGAAMRVTVHRFERAGTSEPAPWRPR